MTHLKTEEQKEREKMSEEKLLEEICGAVEFCGEIILHADRSPSMIDAKEGHANFVTKYDKLVQEELKNRLLTLLPDAVFIGEEGDSKEYDEKGYAFIVDPIDGTTNFIKNYKCSTISVALLLDGKRYMGIVYNPYLKEMFTAIRGKGARVNGKSIHVSSNPLHRGIVLFGSSLYYEELRKKTYEMLYEYATVAMDIRRSGSAAWDLCCIAAGRAELFFELRLSPWDYAAGALIVEEAGGAVSKVEGGPITLKESCSVCATNGIAKL